MADQSETESLAVADGTRARETRRVVAPIAVLVVAEAAILLQEMVFGLLVHATALFVLFGMIALGGYHRVLEALVFVPLLRLLNLGTGIISFDPFLWLVGVYTLLLGSLGLVMRGQGIRSVDIGLSLHASRRQWLVAAAGVVIGAVLGVIQWLFELESLPVAPTVQNAVLSVLVLGVLVGFVEEVLFRGLLQRWLADVVSTRTAIVVVSVLFGFMHSIWFNVGDVAFAFAVSLLMGWLYARTRVFWSIWAIHAMINVMAFAVLPLVAG
jgi:membrane protease YdiL (CAAX protease family)